MIDKKLEESIKKTKRFLEFWSKFHELYRNVVESNVDLNEKEKDFLSNITLVNSRFQDLMDYLEVGHGERLAKAYPIYKVLSIESLQGVSDERSKEIEDWWTDSYVFLSGLLERLQKKKKRIEGYNKFMFLVKNTFRKIKK
jgi:hypothetical protein